MEIISSIIELDERLNRAAEAANRSPDEFRKILDAFALDPRKIAGPQPKDPRSQPYKDWQSRLYSLVAGRDYRTENEATPFDNDYMMSWPFPYSTRSASQVGEYLMVYGNLIKTMNLARGARILEIGSGYGALTYHLASMGHHITCVDVHEPLLAYVRERTSHLPGKVVTVLADMNDLQIRQSFDAVVFFESFHHGDDHVGMLRRLPHLLEPDGVLVLAGEPIVTKGSLAVPYPWGLRMDGLSLWCIRRLGWLELGFEEQYMKMLLENLGWDLECASNHSIPAMSVWLAKRRSGEFEFARAFSGVEIENWNVADEAVKTQVGVYANDKRSLSTSCVSGYLCFGPYVSLDAGFYEVRWEGVFLSSNLAGHVDVAADGGRTTLSFGDLDSMRRSDQTPAILAQLRFSIEKRTDNVEFRMYAAAGDELRVDKIALLKL
jgi:SAM-dependent methyltransferase